MVCPEDPCIIDDTPLSCPALCSGIFERLLSLQDIPHRCPPDTSTSSHNISVLLYQVVRVA